jgi:hypothetical protein
MVAETKTERGFTLIEFTDRNGVECSLQKSSLATEDAIWLGCNKADPRVLVHNEGWKSIPMPQDFIANTRMHLTREQVSDLMPFLQRFIDTGELEHKQESNMKA